MCIRDRPDVDLDRASLVRLERLRTSVGEPLRARESRRKRRFEEGALPPERAGIDAVHLEELLEFDERARTLDVKSGLSALGSDPGAVLRALGVTHLLLVER